MIGFASEQVSCLANLFLVAWVIAVQVLNGFTERFIAAIAAGLLLPLVAHVDELMTTGVAGPPLALVVNELGCLIDERNGFGAVGGLLGCHHEV